VAREDMIMASQEELRRLHVIRKVQEKGIRQVKAGEILSLSVREIRRMVKRVRGEGDRGVIHRSRGRSSNRAFPGKNKDRVIELYREKYEGFGPTLAAEKLLEGDRIELSEETLRGWLIESGDWKKSRKRRGHRQWRERKEHCGEMVQMDGSHHDGLEGRGPACVLMGYIDDATGRGFGRFYEYEGALPAMDSFRRYIQR
jgi:transposase